MLGHGHELVAREISIVDRAVAAVGRYMASGIRPGEIFIEVKEEQQEAVDMGLITQALHQVGIQLQDYGFEADLEVNGRKASGYIFKPMPKIDPHLK